MRFNIFRLKALVFLGLVQAVVIPAAALAEGSCGRNTSIVADGRITQSTIPANATFWYNLYPAVAGRSYSVEFRSVIDRPVSFPFALAVTADCSGRAYPGARNTNNIDPGVGAGGERRSFTVTAQEPVVMFSFTNPNSAAMTYTFSVSETTMFSPSFISGDGWGTAFILSNTTNAPVSAYVTIYSNDGNLVTVNGGPFYVSVSLGAHSSTGFGYFYDRTPTLKGMAQLTHDGPPGAILVDAFVNQRGSSFERTIKFEARRESR